MGILIVDDSVLARVVLRDILIENGYENIIMKASAMEAIEYITNCQLTKIETIDLIMMDGIMPDIEGVEACGLIRKIDGMGDIPIIMVTGKTDIKTLQQAFDAGANDYITKPYNKLELLARVRAALNLKYEIDKRKARESELEEVNAILRKLSSIDGLTGVANRRRFDEILGVEFKRAKRYDKPLSIIMIDIDYFKEYNDMYGHQDGDECLKNIATALRETVKRPGDLVARYGGEEFVVVLPQTDESGAWIIANQTKLKIEDLKIPHEKSSISKYVTISLGLATITEDIDSVSKLIKEADIALYEAKKLGRNCVFSYSQILTHSNKSGNIFKLAEKKHKIAD